MIRYRATVVDLVPGVSDEQRAQDCSSYAIADTAEEAERRAIEASAVNFNRRVYVREEGEPFRIVKGPYILKARARYGLSNRRENRLHFYASRRNAIQALRRDLARGIQDSEVWDVCGEHLHAWVDGGTIQCRPRNRP